MDRDLQRTGLLGDLANCRLGFDGSSKMVTMKDGVCRERRPEKRMCAGVYRVLLLLSMISQPGVRLWNRDCHYKTRFPPVPRLPMRTNSDPATRHLQLPGCGSSTSLRLQLHQLPGFLHIISPHRSLYRRAASF